MSDRGRPSACIFAVQPRPALPDAEATCCEKRGTRCACRLTQTRASGGSGRTDMDQAIASGEMSVQAAHRRCMLRTCVMLHRVTSSHCSDQTFTFLRWRAVRLPRSVAAVLGRGFITRVSDALKFGSDRPGAMESQVRTDDRPGAG